MPYFGSMDKMQNPVIGFGLDYGDALIYCEAVIQDNHYDVLFNGKWMASRAHTEEWNWKQASGVILPDAVIAETGLRIESYYQQKNNRYARDT